MLSKSELKKKFIVEKSKELFINKGFQAVTMTDIVEACNISRGGLYRYYKDTTEIFLSVLHMAHSESDNSLKQAMKNERPATFILDNFFAEQEGDLLNLEKTLTIAIYEFFFIHKDTIEESMLQNQFGNAERILSALIKYGMDRGEFKDIDPQVVARNIIMLLEGLRVSAKVISVDKEMLDEQFNFIKTFLYKHIN